MVLWLILLIAAATGLVTLGVFLREAGQSFKRRRFERQMKACSEQLQKAKDFKTEDLFTVALHLKGSFPMSVVEVALGELAQEGGTATQGRLVQVCEYLGIVDRHLRALREGATWSQRADAAERLGRIGHPRAVLPLIAVLRDTSEDFQVQLAATRALANIRDPAAIPPLLEALGADASALSQPVADVLEGFGEAAVPMLLNLLQSSRAEAQRYWAARILATSRDPRAVVLLIGALKDRSDKVRAEAGRSLGKIGARRAVQPLTDALMGDPVAMVREEAARALGAIADEHALDALSASLGDANYEARVRAMEAMEKMGNRAVPFFLKALREDDDRIRTQAATALERCGYIAETIDSLAQNPEAFYLLHRVAKAGVVESMVQALAHPNFQVRVRLCQLLGEARIPLALDPLLIVAQKDSEWAVRARALEALIRLGAEQACSVWLHALREEQESVRECMLESAVGLSPDALQSLLPGLLPLLQDANLKIRGLTARIVGSVQSPAVVPALLESLQDASPEVRAHAATALGRYPQEEVVHALERVLADAEPAVRASAVRALGSLRDPASIPSLAKAFDTADGSYRDEISRALAAMEQEDLIALTDLLMGLSSPKARAGVASTLGLKQDPRAIRLLERFLDDPDAIVRSSAARALGQLPSPEIRVLLVPYLEDPDARVRLSAVEVLGKRGDAEVARKLIPLLSDPDAAVCRQAALAIGQLGYAAAIPALQEFRARAGDVQSHGAALISLGLLGHHPVFQEVLQGVQDPRLARPLRDLLKGCTKEAQERLFSVLGLDSHLFWLFSQEGGEDMRQKAVEHYVTVLGSSLEPSARIRALESLSVLADRHAVPPVEAALAKDPSPDVRRQALICLSKMLDVSSMLSKLATILRDPANEVRLQAAQLLETLDPQALEGCRRELVELLDIDHADLQRAVCKVLARGYQGDWKALADLLMGAERKDRVLCLIRTLGLIPDSAVADILVSFLGHKDSEIRGLAAEQLAEAGSYVGEDRLLPYLEDPDEKVRFVIVRCLAERVAPEVLQPLIARALDPSPRVRQEVAATLGRSAGLGDPRPVVALRTLVQDPSALVRVQALVSLLRLGIADCSQVYQRVWGSLDASSVTELRRRLEQEGLLAQTLEILKTDRSPRKRADALKLLAQVDLNSYVHDIVSALQDPDPSMRLAAIVALRDHSDRTIQQAIEALSEDPVEAVRLAARGRHPLTESWPLEGST